MPINLAFGHLCSLYIRQHASPARLSDFYVPHLSGCMQHHDFRRYHLLINNIIQLIAVRILRHARSLSFPSKEKKISPHVCFETW